MRAMKCLHYEKIYSIGKNQCKFNSMRQIVETCSDDEVKCEDVMDKRKQQVIMVVKMCFKNKEIKKIEYKRAIGHEERE
jgi:hypothetical protein